MVQRPRNWWLIAGITLPGLMLGLLLGFSYLARLNAEPPQFDAYFTVHSGGLQEPLQNFTLSYAVDAGRIVVRAHKTPNPQGWRQALYRFDHRTMAVERVQMDLPESLENQVERMEVQALENIEVSVALEAPDGYQLKSGYRHSPGIIGALFSPRRRGAVTIEKTGVVHRLMESEQTQFVGSAFFIGWVVDETAIVQ